MPVTGTPVIVRLDGVLLVAVTDYHFDPAKPYRLLLHPTTVSEPVPGTVLVDVTYTAPKFHRRGEPVYACSVPLVPLVGGVCNGEWKEQLHAAGDAKYTLGNEARLYTGGEDAYYTAADPEEPRRRASACWSRARRTSGCPARSCTTASRSCTSLGAGADLVTVVTTHAGLTTVETGAGNDRVAVQEINGETEISTSEGTTRSTSARAPASGRRRSCGRSRPTPGASSSRTLSATRTGSAPS